MRFLKKAIIWMLVMDLVAAAIALVAKQVVPSFGDEESDEFQLVTMMGGKHFASRAGALHQGTAITGMGGTELDLTNAALDPSGAHLSVLSVMGGTEVIVPAGWAVKLKGWGFLGGHTSAVKNEDLPDDAPVLTVDAASVVGGMLVTAAS